MKKINIENMMASILDVTDNEDWVVNKTIPTPYTIILVIYLKEDPSIRISMINHIGGGYSYKICGITVSWWKWRKVRKQFDQIINFWSESQIKQENDKKKKIENEVMSNLKKFLNKTLWDKVT